MHVLVISNLDSDYLDIQTTARAMDAYASGNSNITKATLYFDNVSLAFGSFSL